jgi:hypothetical protein
MCFQFDLDFEYPERTATLANIAWYALVVATVADFLTTYSALAVGNNEDNILIAWIIESYGFVGFGIVKVLALAFVYVALQYIILWKPKLGFYLPASGAVVTGLAAVGNTFATIILLMYG